MTARPWSDREADHAQSAADLVAEPTLIGELRWVPCEACGGSGEVFYSNPHFGQREPDECAEPCGECQGTGRDCVLVYPVELEDEDQQLADGSHYLDANGSLQPKTVE